MFFDVDSTFFLTVTVTVTLLSIVCCQLSVVNCLLSIVFLYKAF